MSLPSLIYLSLFACLIVLAQAMLILFREEAFCLNEGCKIVEALTTISPFYFNLLGAGYFFAVFCAALTTKYRSDTAPLLRLLLISGLTAEGVLLGYQIVLVHSFCFYCIFIFFMVLLLNAMAGIRHLTLGVAIIVVQLAIFPLLKFDIAGDRLYGLNLDDGTYAVTNCSAPVSRLYLIFSDDCPHCHNVIEALKGCTNCEFHFNPIKEIDHDLLPGLSPNKTYSVAINSMALRILDINTIPVLIAKDPGGLIFIKGEQNIITYIRTICFQGESFSDTDLLEDRFDPDDDTCSIHEECQ